MSVADVQSADEIKWRRSLPPGAQWRQWQARDGWAVRTVHWPSPVDGSPSILFLNGRADFIEKYSESYWRWQARGYGVMTFDWRGQGLSGRFSAGSSGLFEAWLGDLEGLVEHAAAVLDRPLALAAHSMGAHLALRYLARGKSKHFARAVLFAPMAGIGARHLPGALLGSIARASVALGRGGAYPPTQGPYGARQRGAARQALLTSDADRFADENWWIDGRPELAHGGSTWRWIAEALASCRALAAAGVPESIGIDVDIFMGEYERLVDPKAARAIAERLPRGTWHDVPDAAHELLRERAAIQHSIHAAFDAIVGGAV